MLLFIFFYYLEGKMDFLYVVLEFFFFSSYVLLNIMFKAWELFLIILKWGKRNVYWEKFKEK